MVNIATLNRAHHLVRRLNALKRVLASPGDLVSADVNVRMRGGESLAVTHLLFGVEPEAVRGFIESEKQRVEAVLTDMGFSITGDPEPTLTGLDVVDVSVSHAYDLSAAKETADA